MTRPISTSLLAIMAIWMIQGCSPQEAPGSPTTSNTLGWVTPPMVQVAERVGDGLVVRGLTAPGGRVVIRTEGAPASATGADGQGLFTLNLPKPDRDTLFVVEAQIGQDAAPAPYRLLAARDPAGPVALVAAGAPSRRLDAAGPLDVIDSDAGGGSGGAEGLASGRAVPGTVVTISVAGRRPVRAQAGPDGRWTASIDLTGDGPASVEVAGRTYAYPGAAAVGRPGLSVIPLNQGWRAAWSVTPGVGQSSWFPAL